MQTVFRSRLVCEAISPIRSYFTCETLEPISEVSYVRRGYGLVADIFFEATENLYDIGKIDIAPLDGGVLMIKSTTQGIKGGLLSNNEKCLIDRICDYWHGQKNSN